jgi:hypothetical protein
MVAEDQAGVISTLPASEVGQPKPKGYQSHQKSGSSMVTDDVVASKRQNLLRYVAQLQFDWFAIN